MNSNDMRYVVVVVSLAIGSVVLGVLALASDTWFSTHLHIVPATLFGE